MPTQELAACPDREADPIHDAGEELARSPCTACCPESAGIVRDAEAPAAAVGIGAPEPRPRGDASRRCFAEPRPGPSARATLPVSSSLGEGTTFAVYLPASGAAAGGRSAQTAAAEWKADGGPIHALVMDDDEMIRETASKMFRGLRCEVETACDGQEAIRRYRQAIKRGRRFDIVVLDLTVASGMGGMECFQRLREIDPNVRGIAATGHFNDPILTNYRDVGLAGVLSKPYRIEDLNTMMRQAFPEGRPAAARIGG